MQTPSPKFFCPSCRTSYQVEQNFCGRCGADMHRASGLVYALSEGEDSGPSSRAETETGIETGAASRRGTDHDRWLGKVVDQRYQVIEVIGRGGMGVVYRVEHLRMGKIAAMKVLHHDLESDPEVLRRFRTEAAAVSRLTHHNTVQVFDFGAARGALYLVMEYVRGLDVGSIVDRDGPMPFGRAAPLVGQVAAALAEAHELGVIHRDLKPENILVTRTHGGNDFVKVLDFGLAKLGEQGEPTGATDKTIVGTPYYMSPEQIRGDDIDARADIYSLGALTYKLLTGEPPYRAKTPVGVLTKHLTEPLVPPTRRRPDLDLPSEIDDIIGRAMSKRRRDRYRDVSELAADVAELYKHTGGSDLEAAWLFPGTPATPSGELADRIDYGIDSALRLQRSDLDGYERSLKRRRLRILLVPVILAALAAAGLLYLRHLHNRPLAAEKEPNNRLSEANLIAAGAPVTGYLGKRVSRSEPDRDFFELPIGGDGALLTVELDPVPNIDLELDLYRPDGRLVESVNEGGVGHGEAIRGRRVAGRVVLMVTEAREPGDTSYPTENVSDPYRLRVSTRAP